MSRLLQRVPCPPTVIVVVAFLLRMVLFYNFHFPQIVQVMLYFLA